MANYNFLKEAKVYVVYNSLKYRIDVTNISFSQTFRENSYSVKTLHSQTDVFEASTINSANAANFSFQTAAIRENHRKVVFDRLLDYATFDLYISTEQDVFKLEKCVITNGSFIIEKLKPLSLGIQGDASKLSKVGTAASYTIPGTLQSYTSSPTYNLVRINMAELGGSDISESVSRVNIELQNEVEWQRYNTVQGGIDATNAATSQFPSTFVIGKRVLAGGLSRYLTGNTGSDFFTWGTDTSLRIKAGQEVDGTFYGFDFNMSNCAFTNRLKEGPVLEEEYNFRMTQNPTNLSSVITYNTT
tara:strand:+ start:1823 stop:2728 length:906 start_codon:yes stop_codon:yes gene_type:complete